MTCTGKKLFFLFLIFPFILKAEESFNPPKKIVPLDVCGKKYRAWVADTEELQEKGLMHFPELKPDQAMIFIFKDEIARNFWMKNCPYDLDIAYFDHNKKLVSKTTMKGTSPMMQDRSQPEYPSAGPAMYAIEVHAGNFAKLAKACSFKILENMKR